MELVILAIKLFVVFNVIMGLASVCTWIERKGSALIQDRVGANRAGAFFDLPTPAEQALFGARLGGLVLVTIGILGLAIVNLMQLSAYLPGDITWLIVAGIGAALFALGMAPIVVKFLGMLGVINTLLNDAVKSIFKEDFIPENVSPLLHSLAPFVAVLPIFVAFAVIPLAPDFVVGGYTIRPQLASLDSGLLFLLAMGSLSVYGVAFAGWCGNNKFSLLGALRATAQMISYELAMGIAFVTVILYYGTMDLYAIVEGQGVWGIVTQPITAIVLFIVGMAETKRGPFDLPESESELVAGYFTEYSGMKFLVFWLGEFAEIALFALIMTLLFLGGWKIPFVELPAGAWWAALVGHGVLMGKVLFLCVLQIVIRWTLPRFRFDQLMNLGWKMLLPLSIANLMVYGALKVGGFIG